MNEAMLKGLKERRSVRKFKPEQIKEEELQAVLEAGIYAPTAKGTQDPIIVVVQDPAEVEKVSKLNALFTPHTVPYYGAPTILLVLASRQNSFAVYDGSAVITNLVNGAHAAGLGACWIHRPHLMFDTMEGKEMLKRWGIEGDWVGIGSVALGYADGEIPAPKARKADYIRYVR